MLDYNLIIGIHSICCAIDNPNRKNHKLVASEDAVDEIKKRCSLDGVEVEICAPHKVQEEAKIYFRELDLEYHRVPSSAFLLTSELEVGEPIELYNMVKGKTGLKILCLDQISDVHNAGAILRTANFYGIDYVVIPDKRSFGLTPSFFRISSGAAEFTKLIAVNKLSKTVGKLKELGVECLVLSEHAKGKLSSELNSSEQNICLILGKEDTGVSHAVMRQVDHHIALDSFGEIKSLNVSIAAAITMEKCFGKK